MTTTVLCGLPVLARACRGVKPPAQASAAAADFTKPLLDCIRVIAFLVAISNPCRLCVIPAESADCRQEALDILGVQSSDRADTKAWSLAQFSRVDDESQ